jgi:large subunit ribosomal protein L29
MPQHFNAEIRALSDEELLDKIDEGKAELFNLRFQRAAGQVQNTARARQVRRQIARLKTEQRQRQLAALLAKEEGDVQ